MACKSASVQRAQEKSEKALQAIKDLERNIVDQAKSEQEDFESEISESQERLGVNDLQMLEKNYATKVDFTHEFDVDLLIPVIKNVLNTAALAVGGAATAAVLLNPKNIKTYADLLSSIAEAVKTNSVTGANTYFAMSKLAPGFFAFTSTRSLTISDKDTFGKESITAFNFSYALYFSEKHVVKESKWNRISALKASIEKLTEARIGLVDRLTNGEITPEVYFSLKDSYKKAIEQQQSELSELTGQEFKVQGLWQEKISAPSTEEKIDVIYHPADIRKILSKANAFFQDKGPQFASVLQDIKGLKAQWSGEDYF